MPETYRSQHTGTLADLIGRRGRAGADAMRVAGDAAAQSALVSGQAWGNAIQGITGAVTGTLADYAKRRDEAPLMRLRGAQADQLEAELASMDTAAAQQRIGQLAQMVKASGYDPSAAEPVFQAIGKLSPEYAQPLMRALMDPSQLKKVTDTLISQTPGYKAPEGFTLSEGQTRFGPGGGEPIASVPKAPPVAQPYTLTPGSQRRGPNNEIVAEVPSAPRADVNPTEASLALMAAQGNTQAEAALAKLRSQRPSSSSEPRPLTQTAEAQIIQRLSNQWGAANKPLKELERQVQLMETGMDAVDRGDLAQGAQMVLVTFQKILDPPSVVRESEFQRSAAGQSLMNRVQGAYERLSKGGAGITVPELRKFATLAREAATAQRNAAGLDKVKSRLGMTADRYNIPRELVFEIDAPTSDAQVEEWVDDGKGGFMPKPKGGG